MEIRVMGCRALIRLIFRHAEFGLGARRAQHLRRRCSNIRLLHLLLEAHKKQVYQSYTSTPILFYLYFIYAVVITFDSYIYVSLDYSSTVDEINCWTLKDDIKNNNKIQYNNDNKSNKFK